MNELQKKCAKIDGYIFDIGRGWFDRNGQKLINGIPAYDNETDILRVVRMLDVNTHRRYCQNLLCRDELWNANPADIMIALKATAEQMLEALAKALGVEPKEDK